MVSTDVEIASGNHQRATRLDNDESAFYFMPTQQTTDAELQLWEACLFEGTRGKVLQFMKMNRGSPYAADAAQWLKDHPEGEVGERMTFSHVSPIDAELSWNTSGRAVALPRISRVFGVPRTLSLPPDDKKGTATNRSAAEVLAITPSVVVDKPVAVKGTDQRTIRLPFGVRLQIDSRSMAGFTGTTVDRSVDQPLLLNDVAQARSGGTVPVGSPLAEINLPPSPQFPEVVSNATLASSVNPVVANAKVIGWASISTPASADPKVRSQRALQATFVKYALVKLGVAEAKISIVENDASNTGDLRLRLFGIK